MFPPPPFLEVAVVLTTENREKNITDNERGEKVLKKNRCQAGPSRTNILTFERASFKILSRIESNARAKTKSVKRREIFYS
jgi:hypothetical protein